MSHVCGGGLHRRRVGGGFKVGEGIRVRVRGLCFLGHAFLDSPLLVRGV